MIDPCPPGFVAVRRPVAEVAQSVARAVHRVWHARPRVSGHGVKRKLAHGAAAAGKTVAGAAVATGVTIVCERVAVDRSAWLGQPAYAAPAPEALYAPAPAVAWGYPGLPGYLGLGGGVLWPAWVGGPAPGDTGGTPPVVGATNEAPPFVSLTPDVPPGVGPGLVPPGVTVTTPIAPPEAPRPVPAPPGLAVVAVGLAALAAARRACR